MTRGKRANSRGDRVLPGGAGAWVGVLKPEKECTRRGGGGQHLQGMDTERTKTRGARAHRGSEKGFQNLTPLIRSPRDNE